MAYDRVLIRDLGSRNGVRVNGRLLEEARLHSGDELAIGPILFRFELESDAPLDAPGTTRARSGRIVRRATPPWLPSRPVSGRRLRNRQDRTRDIDLVPLDDI